MLSAEENEKLTRIGPGTPCGNFLRRYWQPIVGASELTTDHPKLRVRILGEDLVLYRVQSSEFKVQSEGRPLSTQNSALSITYGLVAEQCSHRGASLYYGFLEDGCIRCPYHGWLYDPQGRCVEQPFEPAFRWTDSGGRDSMESSSLEAQAEATSSLGQQVHHPAYPVQKYGGFLWAYMGPPPAPLLPHWDILEWDHGVRRIEIRPVLACNWLQAEENTADITHTYFLHAYNMAAKGRTRQAGGFGRPFHGYGFQPFEWGLLKNWSYGGERGGSWWGNLLIFPNMLRLENAMHWRVPIDDTHTKILRVELTPTADGSRCAASDPETEEPPVTYEPTWLNEADEYHLDTFSSQDGMAWETQGAIFDRTREHLGVGDTGIAILRQMLSDQIDAVARGDDPICLIRDPDQNHCVDLASWLREAEEGTGGAGVGQAAPADLRRRTREEAFDDRYREFEIPPGAARAGVFAHLASLER